MDASNIINLGLVLLTAVGLGFTAWQSLEARGARDVARKASCEAAEHEAAALRAAKRSATAAELSAREHTRSADALERQATVAEAKSHTSEAWRLEPLGNALTDQEWKVTNRTGENVSSVTISTPNGVDEQWIQALDYPTDILHNESAYFTFLHRLTSPTSATIWIFWTPADGSSQRRFVKSIR